MVNCCFMKLSPHQSSPALLHQTHLSLFSPHRRSLCRSVGRSTSQLPCPKHLLGISVVVMLTFLLHEVTFLFFFLPLFYDLNFDPTHIPTPHPPSTICFSTTASWNRSGWHPRSLTGQCTSHLPSFISPASRAISSLPPFMCSHIDSCLN